MRVMICHDRSISLCEQRDQFGLHLLHLSRGYWPRRRSRLPQKHPVMKRERHREIEWSEVSSPCLTCPKFDSTAILPAKLESDKRH